MTAGTKNFRILLKQAISFALAFAIWFSPIPAGLTREAWHLFAIFAAAIFAVILNSFPLLTASLLAVAAAVLTRTVDPGKAFAGFANASVLLVVVAFLVANAKDHAGGFIFAARPKNAKLARTEFDVSKIIRGVIQVAGMIFARSLAVTQVLIQQRFGFLDAGEGQVMSLNAVAIILLHEQIQPRGVQDADDDDRQQGQTPKHADEDGSAGSHWSNH